MLREVAADGVAVHNAAAVAAAVSEADLLDILSKGSNPEAILHHIGKVRWRRVILNDPDTDSLPAPLPAPLGNTAVWWRRDRCSLRRAH